MTVPSPRRPFRLAAAIAFALALGGTVDPASAEAEPMVVLREQALTLANRDRAAAGLPALFRDTRLDEAAQRHAADMLQRNYVEHVSPEGRTPMDRYVAAGGKTTEAVAENIAACERCPPPDADQLARFETGWMNSPGHRLNLLNSGFERFGFGAAADSGGRLYAVQLFAGPGEPRRAEGAPPPLPLDAGAQLKLIVALANERRATLSLPLLQPSAALSIAAGRLVLRRTGEALAGVGDIPSDEVLEALPGEDRGRWQAMSLLVGECGGCGRVPTDADVRFFGERWLGSGRSGGLLDPEATHLGFAMSVDGAGKKTALAVIGIGR